MDPLINSTRSLLLLLMSMIWWVVATNITLEVDDELNSNITTLKTGEHNLSREHREEGNGTTPLPPSSTSLPSITSSRPFIIPAILLSPPPSPKPELNAINTKLLLYTRRNPTVGHTLTAGDATSVSLAHQYKPEEKLRIIVHGSFDGLDFGHWMRDMKTRLLEVEDSNVIVVDWSQSAALSSSHVRLSNARIVGHQVAKIIEDFQRIHHLKSEDVHIIAHGDGTFVADVVGQRIARIGRISGLNPSGPNFDSLSPDSRLDKSDALFVDVIHTDDTNSSLSLYKKGSSSAVGDVDFYPNGGLSQPGCNIEDLDELVKKMVSEGLRTFLSCSHYRAIDYYLESITDRSKCLHMGYECQSYEEFLKGVCGHCHDDTHLCSEMGFRSNLYFNQMIKTERSNPIKLYFSTSRKKPFCLYHYNVQVNIAQEPNQIRGGLLRMRIEGEFDTIEVKIYGGTNSFKAGYTTGLISTHPKDLGNIKGVSVNWIPNSIMTLLYGENLYVEDLRIAQIGWQFNKLKTDEVTTLCPNKRTGLITPFYGDTYFSKSENCSFPFQTNARY